MVPLLLLGACAGNPLYTKRTVYNRHPIAVRVFEKFVDEDSPMEYTVRFRNVGREIVSFDFTLADEVGVPHVDREGPNSGFISNLYPGAEVSVPNPINKKTVWATLGTVTYGKRPATELDSIYKPDAALMAEQAAAGPALLLQ